MKSQKPYKALALLGLAAILYAAAACDGGGDEATPTPAASSAATVGKISITGISSRVVLDNGAVYMTIRNSGDTPDALVKASASIAGTTELHQTVTEGNTTRMEPVQSIEIPAGGQVVLKKGGLHVMMMKVQPGIKVGDKFSLTLTFERAGSVTLEVAVAEIAESGGGMDSGMGGTATPAMSMQ